MRTLFRKVFGPSKSQLRKERDFHYQESKKLKQKAAEGDELLIREIDNLNDENDAINHERAKLLFENERLVKENKDLQAENNSLEQQARRLYRADGSFDVMPWNVDVVALRIDAARQLKEYKEAVGVLEKRITEADRRYHDFVGNASVNWEELVASRRRLDEQANEITILKAHLEGGATYTKLLADEKERLRLAKMEADAEIASLKEQLDASRHAASSMDSENWKLAEMLSDERTKAKELHAENERLTKMLTEPEFLEAEARKEGERIVADASMKHWSAKLMVMSFADSLGSAENCVELAIGDEEFGHFLVTVQRRFGKSPLQLRDEAKAETDKYVDAYRRATHAHDAARERMDKMASALIGLTNAVSDMRSGRNIPTRGYLDMLAGRLDAAIAEADRVLAPAEAVSA